MGTYYPSFYFPLPSPRSFIYSLLTTILSFPSFLSNLSFFLSVTTMSTPKPAAARGVQPQPAAVNGVQPQPAAVRGVQPQPAAVRGVQPQPAQQQFVAYSPSQQQHVVYSPSQQQLVVYSSSRQSRRTCRGPRGRRRKRRKIAQSSEYSMAGIFLPLQQQPGHVAAERQSRI